LNRLKKIPFFKDYDKSIKVSVIEEGYDLWFSRPLGYVFAKWLHALKFRPNGISILGMIVGVIGGFLLYWQDNLLYTSIAFILVTLAGILDSSDGQAARMYQQQSEMGRVFDAIMDNLVFIACYVFATFHYLDTYTFLGCFAIGALSGGAHSIKSGVYEYYKALYMYFSGESKSHRSPDLATLKETFVRPTFMLKIVYWLSYDYARKQYTFRFHTGADIKKMDEAYAKDPIQMAKRYHEYQMKMFPLWAWTSGSNLMRNGILISSLFGRFDLYAILNIISIIPYLWVGYKQKACDKAMLAKLKQDGLTIN